MNGSGRHRLDWNFQFAPEIDLLEEEDGNLVVRSRDSSDFLRLESIADESPCLTLARGQMDPMRGWISRNSAQVVPAYAACYTAEVDLPFAITFRFSMIS